MARLKEHAMTKIDDTELTKQTESLLEPLFVLHTMAQGEKQHHGTRFVNSLSLETQTSLTQHQATRATTGHDKAVWSKHQSELKKHLTDLFAHMRTHLVIGSKTKLSLSALMGHKATDTSWRLHIDDHMLCHCDDAAALSKQIQRLFKRLNSLLPLENPNAEQTQWNVTKAGEGEHTLWSTTPEAALGKHLILKHTTTQTLTSLKKEIKRHIVTPKLDQNSIHNLLTHTWTNDPNLVNGV